MSHKSNERWMSSMKKDDRDDLLILICKEIKLNKTSIFILEQTAFHCA